MACFLVSAAEAVVVTAAAKATEKKADTTGNSYQAEQRISFSKKLKWLSNMLWGGSVLLAFEHVWHGEIVPFFPFLTAMNDPADTAEMLAEMGSIGVLMAVIITAVWGCMVLVTNAMEKKTLGSGSAAVQ
ncbi:hypothetical protein [uncultured Oscillibacter sp.]|uniref:hypothetical protein n=1 Tax=uncultured Oscillibacter sp. TaxID=876091 RepID=UPI0025E76A67|nr:hypothetical protein [uncultured Oscillibacter sp.]